MGKRATKFNSLYTFVGFWKMHAGKKTKLSAYTYPQEYIKVKKEFAKKKNCNFHFHVFAIASYVTKYVSERK